MGKKRKEKIQLWFPYEQAVESPLSKSGFQPLLIVFLLAGVLLTCLTVYAPFIPKVIRPVLLFLFPFLGCGFFLRWKRENFARLFRKIRAKDVWLALLFTVLSMILVTLITLALMWPAIKAVIDTIMANPGADQQALIADLRETISNTVSPNPVGSSGDLYDIFFWLFRFPLQIMGEELLKFAAFGMVLYSGYLVSKGKNRKLWILLSVIVSMAIFGLLHITAYNNVWHCILVIGIGSVLEYVLLIKTKNLWITWGQHILYDSILFLITISTN